MVAANDLVRDKQNGERETTGRTGARPTKVTLNIGPAPGADYRARASVKEISFSAFTPFHVHDWHHDRI